MHVGVTGCTPKWRLTNTWSFSWYNSSVHSDSYCGRRQVLKAGGPLTSGLLSDIWSSSQAMCVLIECLIALPWLKSCAIKVSSSGFSPDVSIWNVFLRIVQVCRMLQKLPSWLHYVTTCLQNGLAASMDPWPWWTDQEKCLKKNIEPAAAFHPGTNLAQPCLTSVYWWELFHLLG